MNLANLGSKAFNLKKGEEKTVILLTGYSFFMGLAYAYFYTTSITLFLAKFDMAVMPYAYMAQGAVSYVVWLSYKRLERYMKFSTLFMVSGVFLLLSVIGLTAGYITTQSKVYAFALFVWYNIFLLLNGISFWGIATKVFDLRQAKRLFGLIGSGEIFARVISFLSVPFLIRFTPIDHLLYLSVIGIIICLVITPIIIKMLKDKINIKKATTTDRPSRTKGIVALVRNKYFGLIFILALFPLFATFYIDFMFLGQVKVQFVDAAVISHFLSIFMGAMSVAEFFLKTFVSGRLLTKYGIMFGLLILPLSLAFSTTFASLYGGVYGVGGMFFSFIILSRLSIRVIRTIFFDPTFQILYQPISIDDRLSLQSKVEGVSKSLGFILAGAFLVVLAHAKDLMIVQYNYIFLVIIAAWLWISVMLHTEYRASLKSALAGLINLRNDAAGGSTLASFSAFISKSAAYKTITALNLAERINPFIANLMMLRLLPKSGVEVQTHILNRIAGKGTPPATKVIDHCLEHPNEDAPTELLLKTKAVLTEKQNFSLGYLADMAASANAPDRLYVARLMAYYENYSNHKLLIQLLQDKDTVVRNAAVIAAGKLQKREFWPYLIDNLNNPRSAYAATIGIREVGTPIVNELIAAFGKDSVTKDTQTRIIKLFAIMEGRPILRLLKNNIVLADEQTRRQIFATLGTLHYQFPAAEHPLMKDYIEADVELICWVAAAILDTEDLTGADHLQAGLKLELNDLKDLVFLQLSMMYDRNTIRFFIDGFESASQESRAYALEVLDMTVPVDIKQLILPLLTEPEPADLLRAYKQQFSPARMNEADRLADIVNKNYAKINPWNKACALRLLTDAPDHQNILLANTLSNNTLISETALFSAWQSIPQKLETFIQRLPDAEQLRLSAMIGYFNQIGRGRFLLFDVVSSLKQNDFFKQLSIFELVPLATYAMQLFIAEGEELDIPEANLEDLFVALTGGCDVHVVNSSSVLAPNEMYWYVRSAPVISQLSFTAKSDTIMLKISSFTMYELLAGHINLSNKIIDVLTEAPAL